MIKNLTKNHYVGIHFADKPNAIAKLVYFAKFLQNSNAIDEITNNIFQTVQDIDFDYILPVYTTKTKTSLPLEIARRLSTIKNKKYLAKFWTQPEKYNLTGKNILVVDDIISSGRTMRKAISLVKKQNPKKIYFIAFAAANPKFLNYV